MSSFLGKIKEYPQISVDRFDGRNLASTAYFLSHAHSDHMIGLSSPQFLDHLESNTGIYLYCSLITARFLQASIRHRPLIPFVRPLQLNETVKITVPNVAEEASHFLWVTLIKAAHCPGSVMFLFEGRGGSVLYTGDFRISVGDAAEIKVLHTDSGLVKTIDSLHIDTTFCHRDVMHFPTREESALAVAELVEDWLARGNNFLIHLICPAKYGYEYLYKSLHDRFGMKIHVSRWIFRMYDTVPEIQDVLTLNATDTWIHACNWRTNETAEDADVADRQLPCRCVPFGVDTAPNIRVIKPSALYYTQYQSAKEIKQINHNGTYCRVLLSMHASCSEVLDLVSYLRPRKVLPNVIPFNSTKEEVLKLLHEALNRSGDHYSIEYGGSQRPGLGSFKRQLRSSESGCNGSSCSGSMVEAGMLDVFLTSPHKRRRHSDSNMTLVLPTPRGNMKGSLSLEGEARQHDHSSATSQGEIDKCASQPSTSCHTEKSIHISHTLSSENSVTPAKDSEELVWKDPYSPSPVKSQQPLSLNSIKCNQTEADCFSSSQTNGAKCNLSANFSSVDKGQTECLNRHVIIKAASGSSATHGEPSKRLSTGSPKVSVDMDDIDRFSPMSGLKTEGSQDSIDISVFSDEGDKDSNFDYLESSRPASSTGVAGESSIKQSRKLWYKHKYFSTPVHEEADRSLKIEAKPNIGPRSCSLPLPELLTRDRMVSPDLFDTDNERNLPLITVSSPSDQTSESQISDETNGTVALSGSSGDPSDNDILCLDEINHNKLLHDVISNSIIADQSLAGSSKSSHRPSVICSPPSKADTVIKKNKLHESLAEIERVSNHREIFLVDNSKLCGEWIDCNKIKIRSRSNANMSFFKSDVGGLLRKSNFTSGDVTTTAGSGTANTLSSLVDLVSDSDCSPEFEDLDVHNPIISTSPTSSSRSSCLKTAKRTHDQVEVVSLDPPL